MRNPVILIALLLVAAPARAQEEKPFGRAADPAKAARTVRIEMSDRMRFTPALVEAKRGETLRFVVLNRGAVMHEMVLGTIDDLKEHAELMNKMQENSHHGHHGGEQVHGGPGMVHLAPGKSTQFGWEFTKAGEFYYGCLIPGHFDAGMIGKVKVVP